ncbi:hypothetical protein quinque_002181 [Culex quinquefasciatus]
MKFPWSHSTLVEVLKNDSKLHHKCDKVCEDIASRKLDLSEFVEELGPALTHEESAMRLKATSLLSSVLEKLPTDFLSEQQLDFLVTFYCDRMKDHHTMIPTILDGLLALANMNHIPKGAACKLLSSLFLSIPCQSQAKDDRSKYMNIIKKFSETHEEELKSMGPDFVYGVIGTIDGERDPRNLIFLFNFIPTFLARYSLFHMVEEMFEVFACYFPIDFHPNQNDPEPITRDMLAVKLEDCLCGTKEFAEHCIVLLLEKLDSTLNIAKLDSLRLLIKCCHVFTIAEIQPQLDDVWKALKLEMLPGSGNKEVFDLALEATKKVVVAAQTDSKIEENFLTNVFISLLGGISDVASKLFNSSIKIALECASASSGAALFVTNKLVPLILSQLQIDTLGALQKVALIEALQQILYVCKEMGVLLLLDKEIVGAAQKQFIQILVQEDDASELKKLAFTSVTNIPQVIADENRFVVYTNIVHILLSAGNEQLNVEDCLYQFAVHYSVEVMNVIVDKLVAKNYDSPSPSTLRIFNALACLLPLEPMREKIVQFFLNLVFAHTQQEVSIFVLQSLEVALQKPTGSVLAEELHTKYNLIDKFNEQVHEKSSSYTSDYLYAMSTLMKALMKQLSPEVQKKIVTKHLTGMDLTRLTDLYLTSGVLGYLDESITIEDHFENLVHDLTKLSLNAEDENVKTLCDHLLCSLFNRMPDDEHHRNVLMKMLAFLREELKSHNKRVVGILSWIGKGLLARGHPLAGELVDDIADLLDHPSLGHAAALAFEVLSAEFPALHLPLIKNLFKQKLFVFVMKKLEQKVEQYGETHLKALVFVYKIAPHLVLKMNMEKVGPILLKCLSVADDHVLVTALKIVLHFVKEEDVFFRDHLQTLLPQLSKLSAFESSMKVRILALECLLYTTKYPPFLLLPFKQDVLTALQAALDDHKRLVRSAAVAARLQWFLIGTSKSDE